MEKGEEYSCESFFWWLLVMSLFQVEGIVLRHFDLGERDRIITFFTKEKGKLRAVAGNIRGTKGSLSGSLDLFTHSNLHVYQGRSLARIKAVKSLNSFFSLRQDLLRMACASYVGELIHEFTQEEDQNEGLFHLFLATLHLLAKEERKKLEILTRVFELRSLALLGYWPVLEQCVICGLRGENLHVGGFGVGEGGVMCIECRKEHKGTSIPLSPGTLKLMKVLVSIDYKGLGVIRMTPTGAKELKGLLSSYFEYHLERQLRSRKFLEHILMVMDD